MKDQGVPCHLESSSISDLEENLSDEYGVIAMANSGDLCYPGEETVEDDAADDALVVAGIGTERGVVILSDPHAVTPESSLHPEPDHDARGWDELPRRTGRSPRDADSQTR